MNSPSNASRAAMGPVAHVAPEAEPSAAELWKRPAPAYCPDGLGEDEICPACGADPRPAVPNNWCRALHSGRAPRPLLSIILTHRDTGEPI